VLLGHEIDPENQIGCTLCFVPQYAATSSAEDNLAVLHSLDKDLYLTDVLMKGQYPKYKLHEYEKKGITLDWTEEDRSILRKGTIDFYGMN
ncbi:family 1 glycosylhydrolase, partial [Erysipelatoclostridium ramosum]